MIQIDNRADSGRIRGFLAWVMPAVIAALIGAGLAHAHGGATGIVKERMDKMKILGDGMKALKPMVRREAKFDAERVAVIAAEMSEVSQSLLPAFPEGSIHGPSEALPKIWQEWDDFAALMDRLTDESARLGEIARGGNRRAAMRQFVTLGKTCKGCHTDFRLKKN